MRPKYRIAAKEVNLMDRVNPAPKVLRQDPRPPYTTIERVDVPSIAVPIVHEETGSFFLEWSDLQLKHLVKTGLLGE